MKMNRTETELTMYISEDRLKKIIAEYLSFKSPYSFKPKNVTLNVSTLNQKGITAEVKGTFK